MQSEKTQSAENSLPGTVAPGKSSEPIYFFFYDGSFLIFFYACASQFYDAFFFYHKAYFVNVLFNNLFFQIGNFCLYFFLYVRISNQGQNLSIPLNRFCFISHLLINTGCQKVGVDVFGVQLNYFF